MCSIFIFFLFPLVLSGSSYQPKELFNGQYECDFKKNDKNTLRYSIVKISKKHFFFLYS